MKKMNGWMKVLVFFPPLLFVLLIGWIALNELGGSEKGKETVSETSLTASMEENSGESLSESLAESAAKPGQESQGVTEEPAPETDQTHDETVQTSPLHLLFAGDILLSDHVMAAYNKAGGINGVLDDGLRAEISRADIFMANEEFPFSDGGTAAKGKQFTFRSPTANVSIMNEIGVDIVSLANNHSLDFGTDALVDTCTALDGAGIKYAGAGPDMDRAKQLQTFEAGGKTIGFLAASRVYPEASWVAGSQKPGMVSGYDPAILLEEVRKAREACDYLVVYMHWGIERDEKPQDYQRALGKKLIDAGADLVMGSHPHVLQGVEYYNGKPICYSMGNFIFGSSIPRTALLRADVDFEQGITTLSLVPGTSKAGYTRTLTEPGELQSFYQYYQGISFGASVDENGVIHSSN